MANPYVATTSNFSIDEIRGELTWNFAMGCPRDTEFSRTDAAHVWRIDWQDMRARILEGDPKTVPSELAHWMRGMTGGTMLFDVAEKAAPMIADWLNENAAYLAYERDNQS